MTEGIASVAVVLSLFRHWTGEKRETQRPLGWPTGQVHLAQTGWKYLSGYKPTLTADMRIFRIYSFPYWERG
jgi:hypothetical protein